MAPEKAAPPPPERIALVLRDTALGLSLSFRAPAHLDPERAGLLLRDEVPVVRRFLDDPVNWPQIGRRPDPKRNAFLALMLSVDRAGGEEFAVLPLDRVCDVKRHARGYAGPPCPLCSVIRLVGRAVGEKLVHIAGVIGEADEQGHYLIAEKISLSPGPGLDTYREKIRGLGLPPVLRATRRSIKKTSTDPAATWIKLSTIPAESWAKLRMDIRSDSFVANGVKGYPADLRLAQHEWDLLCDIAKAGGSYRPKMLGAGAAQFRETVQRLIATLKAAFPQIPGEPLRLSGTGACEPLLQLNIGSKALDGGW